MRYRNRRGSWGPRLWIWVFIFPFFYMSHSWVGALIGMATILFMVLVVRFIMASAFNRANTPGPMMWNNQSSQYRQPTESPYQSYQPYQEGYQEYQPQQEPNRQEGSREQNQSLRPQYEEPQIQYPEEMPPMQQ
ncbi:MAG: hypothetical protein ABI456_08435 [Ktedonobacteraceae bacterium]|nr:hypothetical protein [Chloroflexota bacterium]